MSKLVAFGCEITYGLGLPDCISQDEKKLPAPSKLSWPYLLGKKLGKDVHNLSLPDTSNLEILYRLLEHKFEKQDFCAIFWTYYNRIDQVKLNIKLENVVRYDLSEVEQKWRFNKNYLRHNAIQNFMIMHHAALYLEKIGIPFYFFDRKILFTKTCPDWINIPNYSCELENSFIIDYTNNKLYPGIESHKKIADYFYNKIKQ